MRSAPFVPVEPSNDFRRVQRRRRHVLLNGGLAMVGAALLLLSISSGPAGQNQAAIYRLGEFKKLDPAAMSKPARYDAAASALLFSGPTLTPSAEGVLISAAIIPDAFERAPDVAPVQMAALPSTPTSLSSEAVAPEAQQSDSLPYPPQRPAHLRATDRTIVQRAPSTASRAAQVAMRAQPAEEPGFFQRLFGGMSAPANETATKPRMMAYAPVAGVEADVPSAIPPSSPADLAPRRERTAVYVIEDRTVYMPDGTRLEAHSGLGPKMDNPKHVNVRMHGATPPNTYNLVMREALFHGVEAIRLQPTDRARMFGRDGILAHTYMLGPRGDSNGCVSFRDYAKFLAAFKRGEVTRMVVVANQSSLVAMNTRR